MPDATSNPIPSRSVTPETVERVKRYLDSHLDNLDPEWTERFQAQIHLDVLRDVREMLSGEYLTKPQ